MRCIRAPKFLETSLFFVATVLILIIVNHNLLPLNATVPKQEFFHCPSKELRNLNESFSKPAEVSNLNAVTKSSWERSQEDLLHLKKFCDFMNLSSSHVSNYAKNHMHVDRVHKVVYCYVPKVACTNWKKIFVKLTKRYSRRVNISSIDRRRAHLSLPTLADRRYMRDAATILSSYKKFFLVRHPFDRVLSAYKDKLEREDKKSSYNFYKQIGSKIEQKYRRISSGKGNSVSFPEFIRYISEEGKVTEEQRNEHWRSPIDICSPCSVNYDFMGRYENLMEDSDYILSWLGIKNIVDKFPDADRPTHAKRYEEKYFNKLDHVTKLSFFKKYMNDFLAFRYEFMSNINSKCVM